MFDLLTIFFHQVLLLVFDNLLIKVKFGLSGYKNLKRWSRDRQNTPPNLARYRIIPLGPLLMSNLFFFERPGQLPACINKEKAFYMKTNLTCQIASRSQRPTPLHCLTKKYVQSCADWAMQSTYNFSNHYSAVSLFQLGTLLPELCTLASVNKEFWFLTSVRSCLIYLSAQCLCFCSFLLDASWLEKRSFWERKIHIGTYWSLLVHLSDQWLTNLPIFR